MPIALDATYSIGRELSGVGVYCRELLAGLCSAHPEERFQFCYRPHRYLRSWRESPPSNASRFLLHDRWRLPSRARIFHGLNQRMPLMHLSGSVCTFHDLFVMTSDYSSVAFRSRFTQLAQEAASRSDVIIAVSQYTADQVHDLLHVERSRLRIIHHGVRSPAQVPGTNRDPMILHVGAIQRRKNVTRLVQAFGAVDPPWRLVLAGSAGFGAEETLAAIAASPAKDRIAVSGYVSAKQLADLYCRASVFAFPSLDEGFGMPVLEAMAYGVPVLASKRSALPEVCGEAALLVNADNTDAIGEGLVQLTSNDGLRRTYSASGLRRAAEFSWEKAVQQTWDVYREF